MRTLIVLVLAVPAPAAAIGILGFDPARPIDPQAVEAGLAGSAGDEVFNFYGTARFGLLTDLEAVARAGVVHVGGDVDETGFEIEGGAKFRFMRQQDIGVELAFMGTGSILNSSDRFLFGADPQLLASHHFGLAEGRELFIGLGLGLAVSFVDSGDTETDFGLLGSFVAGVDVVEEVRLSLEARLRDDFKRLGLAVTYQF